MTDKTDLESELVADEDAELDPERDIVEYAQNELTADDLYDVRQEAEELGAIALASRVEIERRNHISHDGYRAQFGQHELLDIGMMLMSAKQHRYQTGAEDRVERINDLASSFLSGFDLEAADLMDQMEAERGDE